MYMYYTVMYCINLQCATVCFNIFLPQIRSIVDDTIASTVWKVLPSCVARTLCCKPIEYDVECTCDLLHLDLIFMHDLNSFDLDLADHRKDETVENKARFFGSMVGIDERQLHDQLGWEIYGYHDDVITGENN